MMIMIDFNFKLTRNKFKEDINDSRSSSDSDVNEAPMAFIAGSCLWTGRVNSSNISLMSCLSRR